MKKMITNELSSLRDSLNYHLRYTLGIDSNDASKRDIFLASAYGIRDRVIDNMLETEKDYEKRDFKRLYYLSIEFLLGRLLENNLYNLGLFDTFMELMKEFEIDLNQIIEKEDDPALGNGGLGRLAACFLDSLATLGMPGYGYGINYEFGLFRQRIQQGYQVELPDQWFSESSPWLLKREEEASIIPMYGKIVYEKDMFGETNPMWLDWKDVIGIPYDIPVIGFGGKTVNFLRLFSARSSDEFDMDIFNTGDYVKAVENKMLSETISKVLYPSDAFKEGLELRLIQEYFLVACALRDITRRFKKSCNDFEKFPEKVAMQLNDTHPALSVVELMRILVDENNLPWEKAWHITVNTLGYTNHTLLPEALEKWSVPLFEKVLPRHLQIIYDINYKFIKHVIKLWPDDVQRIRNMSIIQETSPKQVRMANLAIIGSHSINGVSALHSDLVKTCLVPDFYELWPERFNNKTNGVTQRRWILEANPGLAKLLTKVTGNGWITDLYKLKELENYAEDKSFQTDFMNEKRKNKEKFARVIKDTTGFSVDPSSLFDIQAKRIHEYKRQLLNVMHIVHEYLSLINDEIMPLIPKTYIFAGKSAPGYWEAKQIIKLINNLGNVINNDPYVRDMIKVVFVPDYRVSLAEQIIPAADLSEQISTAGMEASGTGNMKFAMNGALTIGTLDGANIEIMEEVGKENIYIFGLTAEEIERYKIEGTYNPWEYYYKNPDIMRILDTLKKDTFCPEELGLFDWIYNSLLERGDKYFHLADLGDYINTHKRASKEFTDKPLWASKAILNVARMGKFSSDRTIKEYAKDIWNIKSRNK